MVETSYLVAFLCQDICQTWVLFDDYGPLALLCGTSGRGGHFPTTCPQSVIWRGWLRGPFPRSGLILTLHRVDVLAYLGVLVRDHREGRDCRLDASAVRWQEIVVSASYHQVA